MAAKFKERKVKPGGYDYDPQKCGFTETKKFKVLHCGNVEGNNNKFYCLELQHNPKIGWYRLFSHYGRLGLSEVFGVRDIDENTNRPITDMSVVENEFDSIIKSKLRGKSIKDDRGLSDSRRENYEEVQTFSPKVGSSNIRDKSVQITSTKKAAIDTSTIKNQKIVRIIDQIVEENIHNITSLTTLTLTSNGLETPLGPITKDQVKKAQTALDSLKTQLKNSKLNNDSQIVRTNNNLYFSLIPHQFGRKIQESDWILDDNKLMQEYDLLEQLESAVQMGAALNKNASQKLNAIGVEIEELIDTKEFERIKTYVETSKARNHQGADVWFYKIKNIFKIKIPHERARYESTKTKYDNKRELFHGSKNCNILSIMKNGLIIPPCNCPTFSGRAFGDGIYFASASTKSLNYSTNFWNSSNRSRSNNVFLFIADVLLGKFYEVRSSCSGVPSGFNSIWAKGGSSLYNDEFIVPNLNQQTLTYLIEMDK